MEGKYRSGEEREAIIELYEIMCVRLENCKALLNLNNPSFK